MIFGYYYDSNTFYENIPKFNYRFWEPEKFERRPVLYLVATFSVIFLICTVADKLFYILSSLKIYVVSICSLFDQRDYA